MTKIFKSFAKDEAGATAIEYALLAGLISVVSIPAITSVGTAVLAKFNTISTSL